jgi:adenylate cyclase
MKWKARAGMQAIRLAAMCAALGWTIGLALMFLRPWQFVELKLFDLMTVASAPHKSSLPITIVGIDEASFAQLGRRWPWPRDLHAKLIDRLHAAGAAVVAFDLLFPEASTAPEDEAMAAAIQRSGSVVLAADYAFHETAAMREYLRVDPLQQFTQAGALAGLTVVDLDPDAVIRAMPANAESFWHQVVRALLKARPGLVPDPYVAPGSLIRYIGPPRTFPYVSYYQVLNADPAIPKDFFADQIVLVGKDVRGSLDAGGTGSDLLATPFLMESTKLMPGVEVQATILENALMGITVAPAGLAFEVLAMSVAVLLAWPALVFWQPLRSGAIVLAIACAMGALAFWLFRDHGHWLHPGTSLAALASAYLAMGSGSYITEKKRAAQIRSAFSKYVSSDVVNKIISSPETLRLGGERRELTVLFTDLAGFTSVSEKLAPEAVAELVNTYLNEVTGVIMKHGGTVDKYVGDAVMAFWNAPLDDAKHALHAVQAAVQMQEAMDALQPRFRALGVERLSMRVGVHTGPAIVGNMGSDLRFDYTALGDTVNLASRLEGANKHYGTRILLSASTAQALRGAVPLRQVDRVRVKGKSIAVDVYTPCDDPKLVAAGEKAWKIYESGDWRAAESAWKRVLEIAPEDRVAQVFLQRLAKLNELSLALDWDAVTVLE